MGLIQETILIDNRTVSRPALRCLEKGIKAFSSAEGVLRVHVMESLDWVWEAMDILSSSAPKRCNSPVDLENSPPTIHAGGSGGIRGQHTEYEENESGYE